MSKKFKFTFYNGQVFFGYGATALDALKDLGLQAYNKNAYTVEEVQNDQNGQ